jgi:uncharacterized glyoxalase superfamily protein PhnB
MTNRSMPPSLIIPELAYHDVREAVDWLCRTFGFTERLRIGDHRAQLTLGDGSIVVTEQRIDPDAPLEDADLPPAPAGKFSHSIMVRVPDIDSHYKHAKESGGRPGRPSLDLLADHRGRGPSNLGRHAA